MVAVKGVAPGEGGSARLLAVELALGRD